MITLTRTDCHTYSNKKLFGLCDNPHPAAEPAYIDEHNGSKWIAVVSNEYVFDITFMALDNCIETRRENGEMDNRCDGILFYDGTVIFVELKERKAKNNNWVEDGERQLRVSIKHFERNVESDNFPVKKAYIANNEHPKLKESQTGRMKQFEKDTGYILRIENRIILL